jgi:hypothetical protein
MVFNLILIILVGVNPSPSPSPVPMYKALIIIYGPILTKTHGGRTQNYKYGYPSPSSYGIGLSVFFTDFLFLVAQPPTKNTKKTNKKLSNRSHTN